MKLKVYGDIAEIKDGLELLADELQIVLSDDGYPLDIVQKQGPIVVANENGKGDIHFEKKIHFFRALGLWLEYYDSETNFEKTEYPQFETCGAMVDASRNAVPNVESIQDLLRKMAMMGLNLFMIYTEDTYEVEEYPYFGYMRGRYTEQELRTCDQYAATLGIEVIPCIQTLSHLTQALKWKYAEGLRDTNDILLVGNPKTYEFIGHIIKAASRPFQSNRIHIGMDEAHQLGLGKYLEEHGYQKRFKLMNEHLQTVVSITERLGLEAMIWSDMYFRLGSENGDYYDSKAIIPKDVIASIPDVQLVYWDYYHTDEEFYEVFLQKHQELKENPIFAGGVWTWNGISPNYGKAIATTEAALSACKRKGIKETFVTMWGDDGAETPFQAALPMLQFYAEHAYHASVDQERLEQRFSFCTGGNYEDFLLLNQLDETPGVSAPNISGSNPSKFLLYQDILLGLYDENITDLGLDNHYRELAFKLDSARANNAAYHLLFDFYMQLASVLEVKAEIGLQLKSAYDARDEKEVSKIYDKITVLQKNVDILREKHREVWLDRNKPFGWEVLDIRYGGVITRMATAQYRTKQWLEGQIKRIDELEETRQYFHHPDSFFEGTVGRNTYKRIATASPL
ncbi:beta-N-acetylhexosaminidase [Aquibacillus sp. 3ASR75-11]|uniref:Beta-N-acetylhexosaminidase n=1 Tax=Terrihalobacillus insolitus TaxID=2950438 RepID=A0A9X3WV01_9BACI|nr:beta-N-acetylhexosaminidase [Terrihalobacillus insolitus]MDC3413822.1 beta-N-acetylhexosaminidase [Terrihalobacillus insolitus]MDC3424531.1 beta-N-acetylhexosaminidase [Terrihalobacillus insolitus]